MSELEIREAIRKVVAELDLRARTIACGAVIPLVVGVGIATTADCSKKEETQSVAGAGGTAQMLYAAPGGYGGTGGVGAAAPLYAAPGGGGTGGMTGGAAPAYMAPGGGGAGGTDGGAAPAYMAPGGAGGT